ncbi:MAG: hypothetical protein ABIP30_02265 [Ferruginibacter sp.]
MRQNILFSKGIRTFHLVMIWVIPFIWILILKALTKRTPGSYEVENKSEPEPFSKSGYDFPGGVGF